MGTKKNTPTDRQFMMAEVVKTERISPNFVRVTLSGLEGLENWGADHWCRLFFTRQGQDVLALPTRTSEIGWYLQYLATPKARRPEVGEVDIDFVIHGDLDSMGPAAKFALEAKPGDRLGFLDQGSAFTPDHPHDWTLLIGDETALPAIAGICRELPASTEGVAIIEIPSAEDKQEFVAPVGMDIRWIARDESSQAHEKPGALALKQLAEAKLPDGEVHAHTIGESALATGARRHLMRERGVPKRNVDFVGYWRYGRAQTS